MKIEACKVYNPTKIIFGSGALTSLIDEVGACTKQERVMLICGKNALRNSGYLGKVVKLLKGKKVYLFDKVEPNPEISLIEETVQYARRNKIEMIIALGGGSVIDSAKVVSLLADKRYSVEEALKKNNKIENKSLILFAIPTTAGTGSEVTKTSSIWNKSKAFKFTMMSDEMFPDVAIIDPLLTLSLGSYQTASTGLDALSHAMESFWSKKSSPLSRVFSETAIKLVFKNLNKAFKRPNDIKAREGMSLASLYAGLAISNTGTTVGHAISYYLTARFDIAHGLACALSLPHLIRYNRRYSGDNYKQFISILGFSNLNQYADKVERLIKKLQLPVRLKEYGVTEKDLPQIQQKSFTADNITNNWIKLNKKDLMTILKRML